MYAASRVTPVQRMRRQSSSTSSVGSHGGGGGSGGPMRPVSPSKQQRRSSVSSLGTVPSTTSLGIHMNGDYQVLRMNVDRDRKAVQDARIALASSLDQLGEHHVRQKEYDDAMDAFAEALREKRSVFWHITHTNNQNPGGNNNNTGHSRGSSFNSSFLSGSTASTVGEGRDEDESTTFSNKDPAGQDVIENFHDRAIDELVITLRSLGNVHSLRGEQDEAMRYFTEVTTLRAQKMCNMAAAGGSDAASVDTRSMLSSMNDENSTLMSEINEDVKALDDLFRSISFRNNGNGNHEMSAGTSEKRKSRSGTPSNKKQRKGNVPPSMDRRTSTSTITTIVENEPFDRSAAPSPTTSASHMSTFLSSSSSSRSSGTGNEASEAMEMYKAALDVYSGPAQRIEQHKEMLNSLALRVDLLNETRRNVLGLAELPTSISSSGNSAFAEALYSSPESAAQAMSTKAADLDLALEIYQHVLAAHRESGTTSSTSSVSSNDSTSSRSTPSADVSGNLQQQQQQQQQPKPADDEAVLHQQQVASNIASTLICMGSIYYKRGNRVEELKMYQEAKRVYRRAFGENHVFVAGTRKNIGMVLAERGEYDEAMTQFEKAMRIYLAVNTNKRSGSDDSDEGSSNNTNNDGTTSSSSSPSSVGGNNSHNEMLNRDVASAISCMGNVKNRIGELDGALHKYMQALQIYRALYHQALAESHSSCSPATTEALRDVTSTLKVIGMVHAKKGDLDTAMKFFLEAMSLLRTMDVASAAMASAPAGPTTATAGAANANADGDATDAAAAAIVRETKASVLTRIASIHLKKGDLDSAMSHYREAYDLTIRNRGTTGHPEVAGILHYIGGIYHKRADYDEAMACYQESIRIYHATLGPGNPTVAGTLVMVGSIHYKRRHLDSAMMFYREALRLNRDAYGMHHPDVAPILKSIGTILTKKGEYEEAYDVFRDVLSIKCTVHGTDHPEVASAYKSLGNVHYKLGDLADAERQYRHALSIYRRCKGEDHPDTVAAKTTIDHLRYWMRERDQRRQMEQRQARHHHGHNHGHNHGHRHHQTQTQHQHHPNPSTSSGPSPSIVDIHDDVNDERSC